MLGHGHYGISFPPKFWAAIKNWTWFPIICLASAFRSLLIILLHSVISHNDQISVFLFGRAEGTKKIPFKDKNLGCYDLRWWIGFRIGRIGSCLFRSSLGSDEPEGWNSGCWFQSHWSSSLCQGTKQNLEKDWTSLPWTAVCGAECDIMILGWKVLLLQD